MLIGDRSLFTRPDGLAAAWKVVGPLLADRPRRAVVPAGLVGAGEGPQAGCAARVASGSIGATIRLAHAIKPQPDRVVSGRGEFRLENPMTRSFRWPLVALAVGALLLLVAMMLDRGGAQSRDAALLIGVVALYVVLPLAVLWLIVVAVVRARSGPG